MEDRERAVMRRARCWIAVLGVVIALSRMATASPFAYISNSLDQSVSVIDTATRSVVATVPIGDGAGAIALDPSGRYIYVCGSHTITVIDASSNAVIATVTGFDLTLVGIATSPDGRRIYATGVPYVPGVAGRIYIIDASVLGIVGSIPLGARQDAPHHLTLSHAATRLYVAQPQRLVVIDTATNQVIATIQIDAGINGLAVDSSDRKVYVATGIWETAAVMVLDTLTNTIKGSVPGGSYPRAIAIHPAGKWVYVNDFHAERVLVIDGTTDTFAGSIRVGPLGNGPRDVAVDPTGTYLYVVNGPTSISPPEGPPPPPGDVSVVDTLQNVEIARITVGRQPFSTVIGPVLAPVTPDRRTAVEFYHAAFGHYFITADPTEVAALDSGRFEGWARTGEAFSVYPVSTVDAADVCRFFTTRFAPKSSHFYTPVASECEMVKANASWQYEGVVFSLARPAALGECPGGTRPLYRLYNSGQGGAPNHRYTVSSTVRATTLAQGWIAEGFGAVGVIGCVPSQ